ncbi:MAG: CTP pyrophosphohydrolase [Chlamydiae bacterium]|nr:CTP pyrophosphohydrolase [Chlamydiota bacterium]
MRLAPPYKAEVFRIRPKDFSSEVEAAACYIHFDGKYLFLHRSIGKPQECTWSVPGGKMERGENPLQAVIREVHEEVGLHLNEGRLEDIGTLYVRYPHVDFVFHMFAQECLYCPQIKLSDEHQDYRWVTFQDAMQLPLISGAKEAIHHYKALARNQTIARRPFYFLRHGETKWNAQQVLSGETDISLTAHGREQALSVKKRVSDLSIGTVCFSPLLRAKETKDIIGAGLSFAHLELYDLRECNGKTWLKMVRLEKGTGYEVCQNVKDFIAQAVCGISVAVEQEGPVLIVAHGGIHWAICYHMMLEDHPWKIKTCELVHFEPVGRHKWRATIIS